MNDFNDLCYYLESKTIRNPVKGVIPFKLHPYQIRILRLIHGDKNCVIIKARQIGFTTLLAGYVAWRFERTGKVAVINSIKQVCAEEFFKSVKWFEPEYPKLYTDGVGLNAELTVYDEWNYNKNCTKLYNRVRFDFPGKHILGGTPDPQGKLYDLCAELVNQPFNFGIYRFPAWQCPETWDAKRMRDASYYLTPTQYRHEIEAEL